MKRPTIADVARRAGVSKGAVSYALNGQPGVSEATRQRILAIATEIGFSPSSAARALSGATAEAVGLALCRPARILGIEPFFMELISGVEAELSARSYALTLQVVADHDAEIAVYRRWWGERRVDGVLVCDLRTDDLRIPALEQLQLPAVVIGGPGDTGDLASLWSDDAAALTETVEYLVALGHRRIARVGGLPDLLHTEIRTDAFAAVCRRLGLVDAVTVWSDYTGEEGGRATRRLLSSARAAHRGHLRQRRHGDRRALRGPGDGAGRAGRSVHRGLGRLTAVPARAPAADRAGPRHPRVRRARRPPTARRHRRRSPRRACRTRRPPHAARQHRTAPGAVNRFTIRVSAGRRRELLEVRLDPLGGGRTGQREALPVAAAGPVRPVDLRR